MDKNITVKIRASYNIETEPDVDRSVLELTYNKMDYADLQVVVRRLRDLIVGLVEEGEKKLQEKINITK